MEIWDALVWWDEQKAATRVLESFLGSFCDHGKYLKTKYNTASNDNFFYKLLYDP